MGALGLTPDQFYTMRLRDFFLKLHGYRKEQEINRRESAELVRLQTFDLINIQLKKEDRIKDPSALWKFPWDNEQIPVEQKKIITEEQQTARLQNLLKSLKNE